MGLVHRTKHTARRVLARALDDSGLLARYRDARARGRAAVLLYHRVVDDPPAFVDYSPSGMTVSRDAFESQMAYLARHYRIVPLAQLGDLLERSAHATDPLCAVTFDDGWLDNYTHALPILTAHRVPATIFLATNFLTGNSWFWEERLKYVLGHLWQLRAERRAPPEDERAIEEALTRAHIRHLLDLPLVRLRRALTALVTDLRGCGEAQRHELMQRLEDLLHRRSLREPRRFLSWSEARDMAAAGIDFGAHTMTHLNFERCDAVTAETEIRESKATIERELQRPVLLFAYPYGKNTQQVRELVAAAGFASAYTTRSGLVSRGDDRLVLNRIDIRNAVAPDVSYFACRAMHALGAY